MQDIFRFLRKLPNLSVSHKIVTLVPIKMSVSSLTELHTPCQTLDFSRVSEEQHLFGSVTRLNPVFQPILTVTIVTVNIGWNTGFSPVTDLNKGCSLLTMLKLPVFKVTPHGTYICWQTQKPHTLHQLSKTKVGIRF